jgi:5'-3' exonuclease
MRGDASDGLPGVPGIGEKTAASLLLMYGDLRGIIAAATDPASGMSPGPRRRILDAAAYLEVAPTVVAVARDIDLAAYDATLPSTPRDGDLVEALTERWGLGSAPGRLTAVLAEA